MPIPASPYNSVPNGISTPAQPLSAMQALMALKGAQGGMTAPQGPMSGGAGAGPTPPPMDVSPPSGPISSPNANDPMAAGMQQQEELDLFQRVVHMLIDPQSKQLNPELVLLFAGMGLGDALEKTGKYKSNPHRSNEQLAAEGYAVGQPGQTGMQDPSQMAAQLQAPKPPGMPGF